MRQWPTRARMLWRALWRADQLDAAMQEEMRFHLEMEADRLVRQDGLDPQEARRRAHVAFGGIEKYKAAGRDSRGLGWLDALSLDTRLGIRMLAKHRGLALVGGFAMAVAIAIGATSFEIFAEMLNPALPLEEGDRVVALQYATSVPGSAERRVLHDFVEWRQSIRSVEQLSAFRDARHNLVSPTGPQEPITVAEMTASGFAVTRTPPFIGRYLLPGDERDGAAPVVVIGHQAWQTRFGSDPNIVGRTIGLGGIATSVVGVMPEGFRFPVDHQYWIPLRVSPLEHERLEGPSISIFGRLARGATLEEAQAELTIVGERAAAAMPGTHAQLRPLVLPYTHETLGISSPFRVWAIRLAQLLVGALSVVVAVNLAILVYARTVTRLGEMAVRTALGASRRRILAQLFIESLALSSLGALAGLILAQIALERMQSLASMNGGVPYWIAFDLSATTVVYAIALAAFAALIMGVLPGIKATGMSLNTNLRELDGRTGGQLGPMWTTLVVAQVAIAVTVLPVAVYASWLIVSMNIAEPEFPADQFVVGVIALSDDTGPLDGKRVTARQEQLMSRLQAEPGVSAVTFSSGVPGFAPGRMLQFDDRATARYTGTLGVDTLDVGLDLFDAYGVDVLAGRGLSAADLGQANGVVVNRSFVREFLVVPPAPGSTRDGSSAAGTDPAARREMQPGQALGVRFRYVSPSQRPGTLPDSSYEVVGVVPDFPSFPPEPGSDPTPTVYHPALPGGVHPFVVSVRFAGSIPDGFLTRFREIGVEVDPALQLRRVVPLSNFYDDLRSLWRYIGWGVGLLTISVLLLSASGMYALMSFTVARRAREIAIRSALGAAPRSLLLSIFGRASGQLAAGLLVGSILSSAVFRNVDLDAESVTGYVLTVALTMLAVGLAAAFGPARRGLRIQAMEALRTDG